MSPLPSPSPSARPSEDSALGSTPGAPAASSKPPDPPADQVLEALARTALDEDLAGGDITTDSVIPEDARAVAIVRAREAGILAGLPMARAVFRSVDSGLEWTASARDGDPLEAGDDVCTVRGSARSILKGERTALNFLQRLCGIATLTSRYVLAAGQAGARIVDTRKTTPGLRVLEKYAVVCGGGGNHRFDLSDGFMLKDNHREVLDRRGISLGRALSDARARLPAGTRLEVEVDDPGRVAEALEAGADILLLDNFTPDQLRVAVKEVARRVVLEASGGVDLDTVRAVADTGVDLISVGALTHSAPALDLGMDFTMEP